jgi:IS5 family transposase
VVARRIPTETMVRILVLKRLYNLSDEQMAYQLLDRMSYKRFCDLANATQHPRSNRRLDASRTGSVKQVRRFC